MSFFTVGDNSHIIGDDALKLKNLIHEAEKLAEKNIWNGKCSKINQLILQSDPDNIPAFLRLGRYYFEKNDFAKAAEFFEVVLQYNPENRIALNRLNDIKEKERKIDTVKIIENTNDYGELLELGVLFKKRKLIKIALYALEKCVSLYPDNIYSINALASTYRQEDNSIKAKELYEKSLSIEDNIPARTGLGAVFREMGNYKESGVILDSVLSRKPNDYYALRAKVRLCLDIGDLKKAEELLLIIKTLSTKEKSFADEIQELIARYRFLGKNDVVKMLQLLI